MGILKDWWWDIALTLLTKVHPCCLKSQNFLMVFLKPPCLARSVSLRIGSRDFPILNQSHHKTANQRSHDQSQLDICNFTPWLSLAPELRSIHLQILTIVIIKLEWILLRKTNLLGPLTELKGLLQDGSFNWASGTVSSILAVKTPHISKTILWKNFRPSVRSNNCKWQFFVIDPDHLFLQAVEPKHVPQLNVHVSHSLEWDNYVLWRKIQLELV